MTVTVRRGRKSDAAALGDICYTAFKTVAEAHGCAPDLPSPDIAAGVIASLVAHERIFDVVAEMDGRVLGSNFLDERNPISGIGPITVDPTHQNAGAGAVLMRAVLERSAERGFVGIRLVQAAYHRRSLALYLKLGFEARELLACMQGQASPVTLPGYAIRAATADDVPACDRLCMRVHGHERNGELRDAVTQGTASVVERLGRITGYATRVGFMGHAVADTTDDLKALIGAAESIPGPGVLIPARNGELVRWCLARRMRITQTMTLMTTGLYNEPEGAWLPSVIY
ncbi:MAG: GNAT family N-acetyltransferase [Gammaproteobacteria bacterium]